ncbi:MAG: DUF4258 domain-containing protein [Candidatus Omnitrophica bacterium]|nr:DUF4258 domain-containing protein [Candidatus Omnitrophota bacterium]
MKIIIIPLAQKKMDQRGIATSWIEETVRMPDQKMPGYGGRSVYQRIYSISESKEQLLRVVCEEKKGEIIIVTAYLTSDMVRYRR